MHISIVLMCQFQDTVIENKEQNKADLTISANILL